MSRLRNRFLRQLLTAMIACLLASACGVVKVVGPAKSATIAIDPCSIASKSALKGALGESFEVERTFYFEGGEFGGRPVKGECIYKPKEASGSATFEVEWSKTLSQLDSDLEFEPVRGIGKEALIKRSGDNASELRFLSSDGAQAKIYIHAPTKTSEELATINKKLASSAVKSIDRTFPGKYQPKTSQPSVSPCSLLTSEEIQSVLGEGIWDTAPRVRETMGGKGGGHWGCTFLTPDASKLFFSNVLKEPVPAEALAAAGGTPVKKLGAYAYWIESDKSISVMTKSGRHFELHGCPCVDPWKVHSPKLAEKAVARL